MRTLIALLTLTTGCWNGTSSALDFSDTSFAPTAGALPGWNVRAESMVGLVCPDGTEPSFLTVYPEGASGPQPVAVVLHSGAFDFVREPDVADPLAGEHYAEVSRIDSSFATTKMYATLGMYPDPDLVESSTGASPRPSRSSASR